MKTVTIIGAGRVGTTLGRLLWDSGYYRIQDILDSQLTCAQQAVHFIGAGNPIHDWKALSAADIYLLAVPDDAISACATLLSEHGKYTSMPPLVFHTSGVSESTRLQNLVQQGWLTGSLHPVRAFAAPSLAITQFSGTLCALEGDEKACVAMQELVSHICGKSFLLKQGQKRGYHAALSIASNYLVVLFYVAEHLLMQSGVSEKQRRDLLGSLMQGTLENVLFVGSEKALTGPIVRGDQFTVAEHLEAINNNIKPLYRVMGYQALLLAQAHLPEKTFEALEQMLQTDTIKSC